MKAKAQPKQSAAAKKKAAKVAAKKATPKKAKKVAAKKATPKKANKKVTPKKKQATPVQPAKAKKKAQAKSPSLRVVVQNDKPKRKPAAPKPKKKAVTKGRRVIMPEADERLVIKAVAAAKKKTKTVAKKAKTAVKKKVSFPSPPSQRERKQKRNELEKATNQNRPTNQRLDLAPPLAHANKFGLSPAPPRTSMHSIRFNDDLVCSCGRCADSPLCSCLWCSAVRWCDGIKGWREGGEEGERQVEARGQGGQGQG